MSGEFPFTAKIVSPVKCNEKPWDLWVSEIGHLSPRRDDDSVVFTTPAAVEPKGGASVRRVHESHPYKAAERGQARYRRAGVNRLKYQSMSLHGLFPQMDNLNAAVCHMCGVVVKCSAAYRHLLEYHTDCEPILPPPPPAPTVKLKSTPSRSRHKKDIPPPLIPPDFLPKMETSPAHNATAPLSRVVLPQPEMQYLDEPSTSTGVTGEVQVSMESGGLPVVSIQDPDELPLGENITDDILAIMNSEGIQSADDLTNAADWKDIIRDIGSMQDMNFQSTDSQQSQDLYTSVDANSLYTLADTDLSSLQFASNTPPMLSSVIDTNVINAQALKVPVPSTPTTKSQSRSKNSKSKFVPREYDPNKHCGVVTAENPKPCTRSLTCKAHALSLRRTVEGRSKPFDTLLAEHRASKDPNSAAAAATPVKHHVPVHTTPTQFNNPPPLDLNDLNGLAADLQVNDIYASLLSVEDPNALLPDTSNITSLLSQPLPPGAFLLPDDAELATDVPILSIATPVEPEVRPECPPPLVPSDVCWYSSCPRPLALCTFNASHAGGAITLGKKFATVRSNIKSSLSRTSKSSGASNNYYYQNALSLSKTMHLNNTNKANKPEVRKLIVTCSATSGGKDVQQTFSDMFGGSEVRHTLNGHVGHAERRPRPGALKAGKRPAPAVLDLGFALDPLLADEKC
ncbi:Ataxin-7-like protein 1 [Papilio xuthus]|uniref:Ataxin-7-like protein 1 n=1 Tax=Papilio xuthus TaxID=66420 RepID=A0A194Q242_PAPXU|nr:Ataxin-7-like protein 1 [Papilio xuthus]